jgi:hypothetical protein
MFAVITVALISGAVADRMKFGAWVAFTALWATLVYFPVAHWVFNFGVLQEDGSFAEAPAAGSCSGSARSTSRAARPCHINAGAAALALVLVLGKRKGFSREPMRPHNLPLVMLGAGLLWFGWFGFNAGSALAASGTAALALVNTQVATAAALVAWIGTERLRDGHATTLGAASGAVAGLVAITPACAAVKPVGALLIGLVAGRRLRAGRHPEAPAGLRRLARRRRRPPRRRARRHADDRLVASEASPAGPGSCSAAAAGLLARPGGRRPRRPGLLLPRHARPRLAHQGGPGPAHPRGGRGDRHRPDAARRERVRAHRDRRGGARRSHGPATAAVRPTSVEVH